MQENAGYSQAHPGERRSTLVMRMVYDLGYRLFRVPWEIGPREELVGLVETGRIAPCSAIDLGCGTGDNAIFLAQHGFDVTGVDFAPSAVEKAKRKALAAGVQVRFEVDDLTRIRKIDGVFDFPVDYGTLDDLPPRRRAPYVRNMLRMTHAGSRYLLWCMEWPPRWWERVLGRLALPAAAALEPREAERRFGEYFDIEEIARGCEPSRFLRGFAAYVMTRKRP